MQMGHVISAPVFYYSLLLNVYDINTADIFLLDPQGGGEGSSVRLFYCFNIPGIKQYSSTGRTSYLVQSICMKVLGLELILDGKGPSVQIRSDI
jgi:hypothetical protein